MKQIRKRLTYANVMSSIAVFLVLGGATAFAASHLGKNSVGGKQLKKNAVTTTKIKNEAVTGGKIKKGTITGSNLNLSSIGTVPSATNASHSSTADNASHASNSDTVGGNTVKKFFFSTNETTATKKTILSLDGLTVTAGCEGGTLSMVGTTSANAEIHAGGTYLPKTPFYVEDDTFESGEEFNFLGEETDSVQGTFTYTQPGGAVVTGTFLSEEGAFPSPGVDCLISGYAIG